MTPLIAQSDILLKGTEFGPLGWVLSAIFVGASIALIWYGRNIWLPRDQEDREMKKRSMLLDEELKKSNADTQRDIAKAVGTLCVAIESTHQGVERGGRIQEETLTAILCMARAQHAELAAFKKISIHAGIPLDEEIGEMRGAIAGILRRDEEDDAA